MGTKHFSKRSQDKSLRHKNICRGWRLAAALGLASLGWNPVQLYALPFNQDMVGNQISVGDMHRPEPSNARQRGAQERFVGETREAVAGLVNNVASTPESILHGERLYNFTCSPCHGRFMDGSYVKGKVASFGLVGPNLLEPRPDLKAKPDAYYFELIHFGSVSTLMPAQGWRFSIDEHWDIVNYIRSVQNATN